MGGQLPDELFRCGDPILTEIDAALEGRPVRDHDMQKCVEVGFQQVELRLRRAELATGGDDVDDSRDGSERLLEPLGHEGVELVGANERTVWTRLGRSVLAEVRDDGRAVLSGRADRLECSSATAAAGDTDEQAVFRRL